MEDKFNDFFKPVQKVITEKEVAKQVLQLKSVLKIRFNSDSLIDCVWFENGYMCATDIDTTIRVAGFPKEWSDRFDKDNFALLKIADKQKKYTPGCFGSYTESDERYSLPINRFPDQPETVYEYKKLSSEINRVQSAAAQNDSKYIYNGVHFKDDFIEATDGRIFNRKKVEGFNFPDASIPQRIIEIAKQFDITHFYFTEEIVVFKGKDIEIASKLMQGSYINADNLFFSEDEVCDVFVSTVKDLKEVAEKAVKIKVSDKCAFILRGPLAEILTTRESIVIENGCSAFPERPVGVNGKMLLDCIKYGKPDDTVTLRIKTKEKSRTIKVEVSNDDMIMHMSAIIIKE